MTRQRTTALALAALALGAGASQLGIAQADNSTGASGTTGTSGTTAADTIVVNGSGVIQLPPATDAATVQADYQTELGAALDNASQKATFIAQKVGATLGPITNVTETSSSSSICQGPILYANSTAPRTPAKHKAHHGPLLRAIVDPVNSCSVEADVTVTYAMTPA